MADGKEEDLKREEEDLMGEEDDLMREVEDQARANQEMRAIHQVKLTALMSPSPSSPASVVGTPKSVAEERRLENLLQEMMEEMDLEDPKVVPIDEADLSVVDEKEFEAKQGEPISVRRLDLEESQNASFDGAASLNVKWRRNGWLKEVHEALRVNATLLRIFVFLYVAIIFTSPLLYTALSTTQDCYTGSHSNVDYKNDTIKCASLSWFDILTLGTLMFAETVSLTMILPSVASNPHQPHPNMYSKRILDFQQAHVKGNMRRIIVDGKLKAFIIITPRVAEDEMDKQIEASCKTSRRIAKMIADESCVDEKEKLQEPFKCIVCFLDEDRRPGAFKKEAFHEKTGLKYHITEMYEMCEKFAENTRADWFPSTVVDAPEPVPGGNYRIYSEKLSDLVKFEVHYVRRGWRPPRQRRFMERFWAFGETLKLVTDDNVYWTGKDNNIYIGRVNHIDRRRGEVSCFVEDRQGAHSENVKEVVLQVDQVQKMMKNSGKGPALGVAIDLIRKYLCLEGQTFSNAHEHKHADPSLLDGSALMCILDARHKITATDYFWETVCGAWWSAHDPVDPRSQVNEEDADPPAFDNSLDYIQLSQNLTPPSQFMSQTVRSGFSFTSLLPCSTGCAVSGGSGSIMRVPLQHDKFHHFVETNESFLSTVEDFALSMLMMYYDRSKGAHIPEYSMTIAKGKSAMLSTFLRWDGGKLAVIALRRFPLILLHGGVLVLSLAILINASGIVLYLTKSFKVFAVVLAATYVLGFGGLYLISRPWWNWQGWFQSATVAVLCFRFWIYPVLQLLSGYVVFVVFSGVYSTQLILLSRAILAWVFWSSVPIGLYAGERIRHRMQMLIVQRNRSSEADGKKKVIKKIRPRDLLFAGYKKSAREYWMETLIELNTYSTQPGKALMIVIRGIVEMCSYLSGQDTSSWTVGGRVEGVAAVIPIIVDVFVCYELLPNVYNITAVFNFSVFLWCTFSIGFLWVDEFFQPMYPKTFSNIKVQKFLKAFIFYAHLIAWFYAAHLIKSNIFF